MKPIIDMHNHTNLSSCCHDETATAATFIDKAAEVGIQVLGISNHCWDNRMDGASAWYKPQDVDWVLKIKDEIPEDTKGVKLFVGIETEYRGMCDKIGISAENAVKFDYILIPHSHTHMVNYVIPYDPVYVEALEIVRQKLRAAFPEVSDRQIDRWVEHARQPDVKLFEKRPPDIKFLSDFLCDSFVGLLNNAELQKFKDKVPVFVAHPFIACGYTAAQADEAVAMVPDEKFIEMFTLMAEKGVGYDLSVGNFVRNDKSEREQQFRLLKLARQCGVKFTFGTDAHSVEGLGSSWKSAQIYKNGGMTPEDLHPLYRDFVTFD